MIAKSALSWCWQIGSCMAIVGTLSIGTSTVVLAQIVPDSTLGAERSIVTPNLTIKGIPSTGIDGGAIRGANLFHSFSQFNIGEGQGAYFSNPVGIDNILSRVTGANRSDILGRLGVLGSANLFLINPNGIVFGQNASLDVQGSFLATTANAVKLGESGLFSASQPATSNLLSISPSALWFNAVSAQAIVNESQAPSLVNQPNVNGSSPGLQVQPGRTLALVGGDVLLQGGRLTAAGGRIELGSVARVGQVGLTSSGNGFVLGYDTINGFGNISLSNQAFVDASGAGGGDIQIRGERFELTQGSNIQANTLGAENGRQVLVSAPEVDLSEGSGLFASAANTGSGGDLRIDTQRLLVRDGSQVGTGTFGSGKGGNLLINASDSVEVIGRSADDQLSSGLRAQSRGNGNAGNLSINTRRLLVQGGAQISASAFAQGKGGSLQITANSVEVIGASSDGEVASGLFAVSYQSGDAGDLSINTGRLLVQGGAQVSAGTAGSGKGGSLLITAADSVEVIGVGIDTNGQFPSSLSVSTLGSGVAGDLRIDTGRLLVRDGAEVSADTSGSGKGGSLLIRAADSVEVIGGAANGQSPGGLTTASAPTASGDAGDLRINTGRLLVRDGAQVLASSFGTGKGGRLQITAADLVELIGTADGKSPTGLFASSRRSRDAGDLTIDTGRLLVRDGAQVSVGTRGSGKGGSLLIRAADSIEVIGPADGQFPTGLFTESQGSGNAGDLTIDTRRLLVQGLAQISAGTAGSGKGGSLLITASDSVELSGTSANGQFSRGLLTQSNGSGDAGNLSIVTGGLMVRDAAVISSRSRGKGTAGNINITARDALQANNGTIQSDSAQSKGGAITINAGNIRLFGNSGIRSNVASGADNGGNIYLKAGSILAFGNSDILAFSRDGTGGNITLDTPAFFGENYRPTPSGTDPATLIGNSRVDINATGTIASGTIVLPDTTFIQNSLTELPANQIDTNTLLANSCIVRRNQPMQGSFTITGAGGLPQRPGDLQMSSFSTVEMETLPSSSTSSTSPNRPWQKGDPIVEPQGVYRLPNGKLVMSRECP